MIIAGIAIIEATALVIIRANASHRILLPTSLVALVAGMLFEYRRISESWSIVLATAAGSFALSFLAFLPGKRESNYDIENHIQMWPFFFCGFFILIAIASHKYRVTAQLHEGMTLLQTIALGYWVIDAGGLDDPSPVTSVFLGLIGLFALYSVLHAFLPLTLSRGARLWLSLWSSTVMFFLAIDNIRRVYGLGYVEHAEDWKGASLILANYFLLGTSSIYMAQNAMMLAGFLPGKGTFFNKKYFKEVKELRQDHIKRYSKEQASFKTAFACLLFAGGSFCANHYFGLVRSNFAIWLVFLVFPVFLGLLHMLQGNEAGSRIPR